VVRFVEEARIAGQLQHPGVVPVYELGAFPDRRPYFTMKLVEGQTLAKLLADRARPEDDRPRFVGIFAQVCQAVAYAHSRGIIHRDLKPLNIMVGAFGEVQVMDWGLAKTLHETAKPQAAEFAACGLAGPDTTRAGSVLGTPAYMAPEQARGETERVDERCDVFGLGAILCQVLTGAPPFSGKSSAAMRQSRQADLTDALARLDGCGADAELVALARRCLAAEPPDRPRDAGAVAEAVTAYQRSVVERLRAAELERARAQVKAQEERKRRRLAVGLAAAVLALVVCGAGAALLLDHQRVRRQAEESRRLAEVQAERALRSAERQAAVRSALEKSDELQRQARWGEARAVLDQAQRRLGEEGDEHQRQKVAQALSNLELVGKLDAIRLEAATLVEGEFNEAGADRKYAEAFRAAKLGVPGDAVAKVAARIKATGTREVLLAALDDWAVRTEDPGRQSWLRQVAWAAEPNKERRAFRDPKVWTDRAALARLAAQPDVERQAPQLLFALAVVLSTRGDDPLPLLRKAQARYPGDFWLTFQLANELSRAKQASAVGYLRAALALRPDSSGVYTNLGNALARQGKNEEAVACQLKAVALDPTCGLARYNLGVILRSLKREDEAIHCFRKAIELNPGLAWAHTNLGMLLFEKEKVDEAITCYQKAIALAPRDAVAHNNLGNAWKAKGKQEDAVACFRKAMQLDPKLAAPHTNLGTLLSDQGKVDDAIACHRQAIQLDPTYAVAHHNLGVELMRKGKVAAGISCCRKAIELGLDQAHCSLGIALEAEGKLDEALASFEKAVAASPRDARARHHLGLALEARGRLDEAAGCWRKGIELSPGNAVLHNNLGSVLQSQGKTDEALACFQKAIVLAPAYAMPYYNLGNARRRQGKLVEAIALLQKATELDPEYAPAHVNLGNALARSGQRGRAIACYQKAIQLSPRDGDAHYNLGLALYDEGRVGEAVCCFRKAIELSPRHAAAHVGLGLALANLREVDEAIACYRKAIALDPRDTAAHANLGNLLHDKGKPEEAIFCYRKALALQPDLSTIHNRLGNALVDVRRPGEAIAAYKKALALNPRYAEAHYNLGNVLGGQGKLEEAIDCYREAIACDPRFAQAHNNLGTSLNRLGKTEEALAAFEKALAADPNLIQAHGNRSHALLRLGRFAAAEAGARRLLELLPAGHPLRPRAADHLHECQKLQALEKKLPDALAGKSPLRAAERLEFARVAVLTRRYRAGARLYAAAFSANATLAEDLRAAHRFQAACSAALAGCGKGTDSAKDSKEQARLRKQALGWLRADLAGRSKLADSASAAERASTLARLRAWRSVPDLAGVRDAESLARLPEDERADWRRLWDDLADLAGPPRKGR
jgi:tetratricopeptide (TPR) repeat protein